MGKIRKNHQLNLINPKNAGRKAIHDIGIRHIERPKFYKRKPLHLTIKLIRADIQSKQILKALRHAIYRARMSGLSIIHYSLEHNHIHLYAECDCMKILSISMKAFGVSFVKRMNKILGISGSAYKHRYHLRILNSAIEVKNVINYILKNGIKHKRTRIVFDPYNSAIVIHDYKILGLKSISADIQKSYEYQLLKNLLAEVNLYRKELNFI